MTDETPAAPRRPRRNPAHAGEPVPLPDQAWTPAVEPPGAPVPLPNPTVLRIERGGIDEATADTVEVRMGGIGRVDAEEVSVQWGGIGLARAESVRVELGSLAASLAGEVRLTQGVAGTVVARDAMLEQSYVRTLIAQRVTVNRPTGVMVMIAQSVSGDVRPLLDWRGAVAAGAAFGLFAGLARTLRRRG
jgi:hypothetical protein